MTCPRCEAAVLEEKDRDGITIDVCQRCRGIWLDRGELERLIAQAMADQDELERLYDHDRLRDHAPDQGHEYVGHDAHRRPEQHP